MITISKKLTTDLVKVLSVFIENTDSDKMKVDTKIANTVRIARKSIKVLSNTQTTTTMVPFSNGTESRDWYYNNCLQCKRSGCRHEHKIALGEIVGEVPQKTADYVGGFDKNCQNFLENPIKRVKKIKKDINQIEIEL